MIKLSNLGKDLVDGVPSTKLKNYLKSLLNEEEIETIKKNEFNQNFNFNVFFKNIESSFDLEVFIVSIYKDRRLNYKEESLESIKEKIYQNIINVLVF